MEYLGIFIHAFATFAVLLGVSGSVRKTAADGKEKTTWVGVFAAGVAILTFALQFVITVREAEESKRKAAEIVRLLNNSEEIVAKSKTLEAGLSKAIDVTKKANRKAEALNSELSVSLKRGNAFLESSIKTSVKRTQNELGGIVDKVRKTLQQAVKRSASDLESKIDKVASEDEMKRYLSKSIERKLDEVGREIDATIRSISSLEKQMSQKAMDFKRSSDGLERGIKSDLSSMERTLRQKSESQKRELSNISRTLSSLGRQLNSLERKVDRLRR